MTATAGSNCALQFEMLLLASETRKPWQWILGGTLALFLSGAAIFILGGIWDAAFGFGLRGPRKGARVHWLAVGGVWLAAFLSLYMTVYAQQAESRYMQSFWAPQALGAQATLAAGGELAFHAVLDPGFALGKKFPQLLLIATGLFNLVGLARVPLLASVPILLVIIAAALGKWMLVERLMLFYLPLTLLAIAYGMETIAALRREPYTAVVLSILLASFPPKAASWIVRHPAYRLFERLFSSPSALLSPETLHTAMPSPCRLGFSTTPIGAHQIKSESPGVRWHPARAVILPGIFLHDRPPCNTKDSRHHEWDGRLEIVGRPDGLFRSAAGPRLGEDGWTENE